MSDDVSQWGTAFSTMMGQSYLLRGDQPEWVNAWRFRDSPTIHTDALAAGVTDEQIQVAIRPRPTDDG